MAAGNHVAHRFSLQSGAGPGDPAQLGSWDQESPVWEANGETQVDFSRKTQHFETLVLNATRYCGASLPDSVTLGLRVIDADGSRFEKFSSTSLSLIIHH